MSWSTSELRVRLAPWNRFKSSSKIFYWPFQGGTSFVDLLCFSVLCLLCLCARLFFCVLWSPAGKGPLGSCLWCITVSLSLSHWYLGSGVVLDCINSWSLLPFLLLLKVVTKCYVTRADTARDAKCVIKSSERGHRLVTRHIGLIRRHWADMPGNAAVTMY